MNRTLTSIAGAITCLVLQPSYGAEISAEACTELAGQTVGEITVLAADWLEIDSAGGRKVCVVSGHRAPFLDLEIVLPTNWSGRYLQQGGGGFDGAIPSAISRDDEGAISGLHEAVVRFGAVYAASNGGNRRNVSEEAAPGVWLKGNSDSTASLLDYSYLATKATLDFAHGLVERIYERPPDFRYFNGCSNGGRNAYIAAQRWPEHFDGVVSGCEPMNLPGTTTAWLSLAGVQGTPAELTAEQYSFAYAAAVSSCDADDGAVDGVIANPAACDFPPQSLACNANDSEHCLSAAQVGTLEMLLSDVVDPYGKILASGFYWADFGRMVPGFSSLGAVHGWIGTGDESWMNPEKQRQFNPGKHHYEIANGLIRSGLAHDRIGIAQYVASGKKLISWHAGADDLLSPADHVRLFNEMMGTASDLARGTGINVGDNARLFMVPGVGHGGGARSVGWIEAIIEWTESGRAPQNLTHTREDGSMIPVCRFPAYPQGNNNGYECSD